MIYTITLNPALDRTVWVNRFDFGETARVVREERYPGGKGIDVSRMIRTLGGDSVALGFSGGYTGLEMEGRLSNEGIPHDFIRISGETRTNIIVHSLEDGAELKLVSTGPQVVPVELGLLLEKVRKLRPAPSFVALSGSVPPGLSPAIVEQLILLLENMGAKVVLDADGEALKKGISATPFMIKPNLRELSQLAGKELSSKDEIIAAAKSFVAGELELVVVSAGKEGIIAVDEEKTIIAKPPKVEVVNTVGSGDSAVAGIIFALNKGDDIVSAIKLGVAAGTATAMTPGTAQGTIEDIEALAPQIEVEVV